MYNLIIIRYGEINLKGDNKHDFIGQLIKNIDHAIADLGDFEITTVYGRIFLHAESSVIKRLLNRIIKLPGIVSASPAVDFKLNKAASDFDDEDYDKLKEKALKLFEKEVKSYPCSFKVETNRADKSFPIKSPKLNAEIGSAILTNIESKEKPLKVDVHNPDHLFEIEITRGKIYLFINRESGPGGLPVKSSGQTLLMLSGGIDSPVAGWYALKRGLKIGAVYFHSPPYTSARAKEKVKDLARILSKYGGEIKLQIPYFTEIQQQIVKKCPEKYTITIMRRMMVRIANHLAKENSQKALITGESLGQVASQTLEGIQSTDDASELPILRPLITSDKNEIIELAKKIDSYEISIRPYEDCCTVFIPEEPVTKPILKIVRSKEAVLNIEKLIKNSLEQMEVLTIN
ncbi:thiamine biosynthesis/tRNA modification protein ThiI [Halanaerobium hydrogeniformans]|uniref:Probable tRNA sulfurtransferase n=1 Tax=Halanaerobium hydrogeniformans TaxID=656519 RepID=E4RJL9_HALHG|nr:tRNA uracil 4-sulfurtransferase ThiI [Halanaerobium hydrogeniformans]ADQ15439.1 thiamine biosynthesis/tRNA modification protein ThiI [Halanaerobium hydrogeniformans]